MTAAIVVLCMLAAATLAGGDEAITLGYVYERGTIVRYDVTLETTILGAQARYSRRIRQTVQGVNGDGQATLLVSDEGGLSVLGEIQRDLPGGPSATKALTRFGKLVEYRQTPPDSSLLTPPAARLMAALTSILLSDARIKPGDSWRSEVPNPAIPGRNVVVSTSLIGMESGPDGEVAHLSQMATAPFAAGAAPSTIEVEAWLLRSNGRLVRMIQSATGIPTELGTIDWKLRQALVPARGDHP